jgi:hypothetical protein
VFEFLEEIVVSRRSVSYSVIADSLKVRLVGKVIPSKVLEGRKILLDAS